MGGNGRGSVARDLAEEAKKRAVLLLVCVFGLAYLMSLTSSSVWINLPAAASLIIFLRYLSIDLDVRRRTAASDKQQSLIQPPKKTPVKFPMTRENSNWRVKVNSPAVEAAIDHFARHLISEWVTDLWYSRITPDTDGPEELVQIFNEVLGEISYRARDINLIDLLTRDIINLVCNHLELFRIAQSKIGQEKFANLPVDDRDAQLKIVLAADNNLHPALFSVDSEHKVLQHLMTGLISLTFKSEDLQCCYFRYTVRELLSCAVMRPVVNLANPRVINEKIESLAATLSKKGERKNLASTSKRPSEPQKPKGHTLVGLDEHSGAGVELVRLNPDVSERACDLSKIDTNGIFLSKNPNYPMHSHTLKEADAEVDDKYHLRGEWAHTLDAISKRKTQVLAPEHLENMWAKGRNYKKESEKSIGKKVVQNKLVSTTDGSHEVITSQSAQIKTAKIHTTASADLTGSENKPLLGSIHANASYSTALLNQEKSFHQEDVDSNSSYSTEDDENSNVMGLDSPGTRVWDSKSKTKTANSKIRHPLENSDVKTHKRTNKVNALHPRTSRVSSGRKRHRLVNHKIPTWQEIERSTFLLGDGKDILNVSKRNIRMEGSSDDSEEEKWGGVQDTEASSIMSSISVSEACDSSTKSSNNNSLVFDDSFFQLRCEVLGANVVKSGSGTFAVYSISVTDADNNSWSIKRRFRHFEELHRRLKEFSEYNLSLPPKHFLSSGLDATVVQERCKLLDRYLKNLLQLPTVSGSIEVWDFLSVDSQTYMFSDSLSIVQTLSVSVDDKRFEKGGKNQSSAEATSDCLQMEGEFFGYTKKDSPFSNNFKPDSSGLSKKVSEKSFAKDAGKYVRGDADKQDFTSPGISETPSVKAPAIREESQQESSQCISEIDVMPTIPTEWVPPNLSIPILDLVDVIFQLQDGGWIRRQAFWVAKQVLQLGMGDAFDDWLIEKIQLLRKGSIIAAGIERIEKILWPDGIFITKHPNRRRPPQQSSTNMDGSPQNIKEENQMNYEQQAEASRREKIVHDLIIDKAPAALVGLVGRKEYQRCAQDIYFFLQSSVCLKQLVFELLELLLLAAFPELDDVVRCCHEDKEKFGSLDVK